MYEVSVRLTCSSYVKSSYAFRAAFDVAGCPGVNGGIFDWSFSDNRGGKSESDGKDEQEKVGDKFHGDWWMRRRTRVLSSVTRDRRGYSTCLPLKGTTY
jgi:hypothetical protein